MEENTLPFQYAEIQVCNSFLESMDSILKDSDAIEEKEVIRNFLKKAANTFHFVVIGDSKVGKTSLLKRMFGEAVVYGGTVSPTIGIQEFRYGEENAEFQLGEGHIRIFSPNDMLKGITIIDMQGCSQSNSPDWQEKVRLFIKKSDVLIAAFQADSANSYAIWDLLEGVETRKVVCVLTKADLFPENIVEQSRIKVRRYLADAGIEAPVFAVSAFKGAEKWDESFQELKTYIDKNIIGGNPGLKKQRGNILELKELLGNISASFQLRKRQYEADLAVLEKINHSMDGFLVESREKIDLLKDGLRREIDTAIDAYENEIIVKLNPRQIRERFPNGYSDFVDYLNFVNEGYRKKMTDNVNRKTQETIRAYLSQLGIVFDEATGYFRNRESLLQLEDRFYGSMAKSKQGIVAKLGNDLQETKVYYGSLTKASEELFMKIWSEREKYDRKVTNSGILGGIAGSVAGAGGVYGVAALLHLGAVGSTAVGAAAGAAGAVGAAAGAAGAAGAVGAAAGAAGAGGAGAAALIGSVGVLWPVVAAVVGGVVIASMAKKIASAKSMAEMEVRVREAIDEFRAEVSETREQMTGQIMETIEAIFRRELDTADKTFLDFRKSVNIDGRNIPILEDRMEQINAFMQKIEQAERERSLE